MRFFNREKNPNQAAPAAAASNGHSSRRRNREYTPATYTMMHKPPFGQWLKHTWGDILTMVLMGVLGLAVYEAPPAPTRSFPVTFSDGEIVYPEFGYPLRKEIIPIWLAAFLAAMVPICVILLMQIRVRSFWDVNNGILGLLYSLITAAVFQVFLKCLIGGLRPHFLDVCKPDISRASNGPTDVGAPYNAAGFKQLYYTSEICTGDQNEINDSLESFPSGHSTAAFAGFVYLYLYLNAKLKVFSNYHPAMWKLVLIYAPILGATLIAGALTIDEYHHWWDVLAGAVIGTVMAFSAYRMVYAAVWDWRFNHIPLNRTNASTYALGGMELEEAVWTRRVGWGIHPTEHYGGGAGPHHAGAANNGVGGSGVGTGTGGGVTHPRKPIGGAGAGSAPRRGDEMV
ncbi:hypothetical protein SLS62_005889 [Diatrype stigma]|uniref:Phosphatidic acid phosphatase type 2/haloperoxidase domain-containing protein n=1 Tax=Diatrype stigma TaxID=117547 RepID=A0AAN9UNX8_9PEZI